ncbi:hypothetical protein B0A49_00699 [Cryomyces minteri]|uniref:Uncharacterized protein n=1 Tax=Cryomyces minteri TaxID=331657 RepID=A0A4U0XPQ5_9PEZI|nr:hypothetical protein B0A49_00699 [Cryomyces minteri]
MPGRLTELGNAEPETSTKTLPEDQQSSSPIPFGKSAQKAGGGPLAKDERTSYIRLSNDPTSPASVANDPVTPAIHANQITQGAIGAAPGALPDIDVEALIKRIHGATITDGPPTSHLASRHLPKDFGLTMYQPSPENYLMDMEYFVQRREYRKKMGIKPLALKGQHLKHGFDPVQVIRKHAINSWTGNTTHPSDLDIAIHPIFRVENFDACPQGIYDVLKPALRLSSLFLTSRATAPFFHTLIFGQRERCNEMSELEGVNCFRIREDVPWVAERATWLDDFLKSLANKIHFQFKLQPEAKPLYGSCDVICDYKTKYTPPDGGLCLNTRVCLHADFYTTAARLSLLKRNADPAMVLRFNFFLAVNLTHEIAHFLEISHNAGAVLGGRVHPISQRIDCAYGLATFDWPPKALDAPAEDVYYTVPMEYVERMQRRETWAQDFAAADWTVFHIPRSGARSLGYCAFNMIVWADEAHAGIVDDLDDCAARGTAGSSRHYCPDAEGEDAETEADHRGKSGEVSGEHWRLRSCQETQLGYPGKGDTGGVGAVTASQLGLNRPVADET